MASNRARLRILSILMLIVGPVTSTPAHAEIRYGPWQKTSDCRTARAPSGMFRGAVTLPQAGGGGNAMECKWAREVQDCPTLRDHLAHPIVCAKKRQQSDYTLFPPRD